MPDGHTPTRAQHETLAAALAAAQGDLPHIKKDQTAKIGPGREYRYADLATVLAAVRPVLSRHGWHIIRLNATAQGQVLPYETVRPKIAQALEKAAWARASRGFVETLAKGATITGASLAPI